VIVIDVATVNPPAFSEQVGLLLMWVGSGHQPDVLGSMVSWSVAIRQKE
jgi:hypothetical protein